MNGDPGFPTVPEGKAWVRVHHDREHTRKMIDRALEILTATARKMEMLG